MSHQDIWKAVERLAELHGLSPSGLAKKAGLDATTFNKSKRILNDGRLRWPSTESIMRVLDATNTNWDVFVTLMTNETLNNDTPTKQSISLLQFSPTIEASLFNPASEPQGKAWEDLATPDFGQAHYFALELMNNDYAPLYREGDRLILSSKAEIRKGDRLFLRMKDGQTSLVEVVRQTVKTLEAKTFASAESLTLQLDDIAVKAKIMWVSQ